MNHHHMQDWNSLLSVMVEANKCVIYAICASNIFKFLILLTEVMSKLFVSDNKELFKLFEHGYVKFISYFNQNDNCPNKLKYEISTGKWTQVSECNPLLRSLLSSPTAWWNSYWHVIEEEVWSVPNHPYYIADSTEKETKRSIIDVSRVMHL
jgi:hypothetical protein